MQFVCPQSNNESVTTNPDNKKASPNVEGKVLEGSVMVNLLKPGKQSTFGEYATNIFVPKVTKELQTVERLNAVFDTYKKDSLKATTRQKRGKGLRRKVEEQSLAPKNCHSFLRIDKNKTEVFKFLSERIVEIETNKMVVSPFEDKIVGLNGQTRYVKLCGMVPV